MTEINNRLEKNTQIIPEINSINFADVMKSSGRTDMTGGLQKATDSNSKASHPSPASDSGKVSDAASAQVGNGTIDFAVHPIAGCDYKHQPIHPDSNNSGQSADGGTQLPLKHRQPSAFLPPYESR